MWEWFLEHIFLFKSVFLNRVNVSELSVICANKLCVWHEHGIIPCLYIWQCHTFPRWWFSPFLLSFAWCCSLLNALTCQSQPECNNVYIMYLTFNMALNLTWLGSSNCLLASLCETWTCNTSCHTTTNTVPTLDRIQCIPTYPDITCPGLLTVPVLIAQLHPLHGIHALDKPNVLLEFKYLFSKNLNHDALSVGRNCHLELNESVKDKVLAEAESLDTRHTFLHFMPMVWTWQNGLIGDH